MIFLFSEQCVTPLLLSGTHRSELIYFDIQMPYLLQVGGKILDKDESQIHKVLNDL